MDIFMHRYILIHFVLMLGITSTVGYQIDMKMAVPNNVYNGFYPTYGTVLFRSIREDVMVCQIDCSLIGTCRSVFYDTATSTCSCFRERSHDFAFLVSASHMLYYGIIKACHSGWLYYESSCYYIASDQTRNRIKSKDVCDSFTSHIVTIDSSGENEFLKEAVSRIASTGSYLIGLYSPLSNGQFVWEETMMSPTFTDWDFDQPDYTGEYCTAILYTHGYPKWHDVHCGSSTFNVICEYDPGDW